MTDALLVLEDGATFEGRSFGATGEALGEVVFNTGMTGYQEVLTDPSYARQIVVMTHPHVGNYGTNDEDLESDRVRVAGFVVREAARRPSSWRAVRSLGDELAGAGVVGIEDLDTRALTLHIRESGAMGAAISTEDLDPRSLVARVRDYPGMLGADLAASASVDRPYAASDVVGDVAPRAGRTFRVAALDWGLKRNSLRLLARSGCQTTVFPARTSAEKLLAGRFDGAFLSNGPGDPAATGYAVETVRGLVGRIPLFGICLGHQILARAIGGRTYKLTFGHRGANQPVLDIDTRRVEITSHNHGFAVDPRSFPGWADGEASLARSHTLSPRAASPPALPEGPPVLHGDFGPVALTHWNLNDGTLEGMRLLDVPALSVQYHPEAAPGPHDSAALFDRFVRLMEDA
ncbi:MAG TPA: glutamine-hydrolyzing carbamoyl-phosphate synthase small subunit [Actinomycetota bacterium]|nr:glutamine-hydrolyzing carbamoyl-phosphate synthase small subunit [Actinomycetota bacterium]